MHFDPLQSRDGEESRAELIEDYLRAPRAANDGVESTLVALCEDADRAEALMNAVWAESGEGARACDESLARMQDALPVSRTLFRERVSEEQRGRLYRALSHVGEGSDRMKAALLRYAEVGERLRALHMGTLSLKRRIYAVRGVANAEDAQAQTAALERLQALDVRCRDIESALTRQRTELGQLCFDTVPRFLDAWRVCADADGDGAACDASRVRALCAELRTALRAFL